MYCDSKHTSHSFPKNAGGFIWFTYLAVSISVTYAVAKTPHPVLLSQIIPLIASASIMINRTNAAQRDKFISSPYNFPYSGYYDYGSGVNNQGSDGYWWSRSSFTAAGQAYNFRPYTDGRVNPQNNNDVGYGFAVRCVVE